MLRSRVRPISAQRWPLRALLALALPAALASLLLGPASPAHAAGTLLYVPTDNDTVAVIDTSSDTAIANIAVPAGTGWVAVTPDGSQVFATSRDTFSAISTATDTVTATISLSAYTQAKVGLGGARQVVVDPSGTYAYVITEAGYLIQISTATDAITGTVYVGDSPLALAISPDGSTVYTSGLSNSITVVDTATLTVKSLIFTGGSSQSYAIAVTPDGKSVYATYNNGFAPQNASVLVISTATDQVTGRIAIGPFEDFLGGLAITPDGSSVYVTDGYNSKVDVISTATNTITDTITGFSDPSSVTINSAGTTAWVGQVAFGTGDPSIQVVDTASNTITGVIPGYGPGAAVSTSYYDFVGFLPPVDEEPAINQANAGQAIPMQFSLNGNQGTDIFTAGYPAVQQVDCSTGVPVNSSTLTDADTSGSSGLQYDASTGTYTYVWKTDKAWAGTCQQFILGLNDGSTHTATFQFK